MARFDKDTLEFMEKVSDGEPPAKGPPQQKQTEEEEGPSANVARQALGAVKGLSSPGKRAATAAQIAANIGARQVLKEEEKTSGANKLLQFYELLHEHFGKDWWDWEVDTIRKTLADNLGNDYLQDENLRDMVQALQTLVKTNYAHELWHVFEKVAHALNGNSIDWQVLQPLEPDEAAVAVKVIKEIRPKQAFEDEVCGYIATCCHEAGLVWLPEELFPKKCRQFLHELNKDTLDLKQKVRKLWGEEIDDIKLPPDDPVMIQLGRLEEIREKVDHA